MKMKYIYSYTLCITLSLVLLACNGSMQSREHMQTLSIDSIELYPDYQSVTIPPNIAPLNFRIDSKHSNAHVLFSLDGEHVFSVNESNDQFNIPQRKWKKLLSLAKGKTIEVQLSLERDGEWIACSSFNIHVAEDEIDGGLVYRKIQPGYELWNTMGIYKRDLTTFNEETILENKNFDYSCMNCHSFCNGDADKMLYHLRGKISGSFMQIDGETIEIDTSSPEIHDALVYPAWHPSGKYIVFSSNNIQQGFHANNENRIEVFDISSDIVVYDVEKNRTFTSRLLSSKNSFETFPSFSSDGKTLYFCSANSEQMPQSYDKVRYHLCSISFDALHSSFGNQVDTLYDASQGGSVSFPRESPNGEYLAYTLSDYGNFSIWHKESDLKMIELESGKINDLDVVNSSDVESYHSWSRNSRWLVFSSRRDDGLYTRPYITYINKYGNACKPFLLPQRSTSYYDRAMHSFNIPELVVGD